MNYLQVELPLLHMVWKRSGQEDRVCSVIRTNYPKPSTLAVASTVRSSAMVDVRVVDMKIRDQGTIIPYRSFMYEEGLMEASRMGSSFESVADDLKWADIIGLSINPTMWATIALDFICFAKQVNPKLKVFVGGTDPMFRPEFYLRHGVDVVFLGEAEYSCISVINEFSSSMSDLSDIHGIAYNLDGRFMSTKISRGCNMDDIQLSAFDLVRDDIPLWTMNVEGNIPSPVQTPIGFIFISRGCNNACDYCTTPRKYGRHRVRRLSHIRSELEMFQKFGINTINIWDDSLSSLVRTGRRSQLLEIIGMIREMGFAYEFSQGMVIKDLWDSDSNSPDYELITELYRNEIRDGKWVGCYGAYFPMEFLQMENASALWPKLMSYEKELAVLRAILDQKISWLTYACIIGHPDDGDNQVNLAAERLNEVTSIIESYGVQGLPTPFIYSVFPGTRLWRSGQGEKCKYPIAEYPELYQLNATPHGTKHFSPGQLMEAKARLESKVLSPEQCERWWQTGHYQWK